MKRVIVILLITLVIIVGMFILFLVLLNKFPDKVSYLHYKISPEYRELQRFVGKSGATYECSKLVKARKIWDRFLGMEYNSMLYFPVDQREFDNNCVVTGVLN